ncbi:alpha/beta fold hydrolase [Massilia sp. TS11]|uniref:alpha/beta fold hydrolase n=1 Tax=Massilia sp. TS11 TaxID=2908003 RepID=UPI001EDB1030|nr:alpha/beta hydrolase [Massilia sp. TS11]MCG2584380.1 alpha/beta hydrolase [Massilia sp. TS11]
MIVTDFYELRYTSRDGLRLYARDYPGHGGEAKLPVICIHGLTRNSADFEDVAPWIAAQGRRVIAVDVRGRGFSDYDPDPAHYVPPVYADDVAKLAHDLGIERAVFIGTSMGGLITMTVALKHSKLIAAAVLNDVGPAISVRGLTRIAGYAGRGEAFTSWEEAAQYTANINSYAFPNNSMDEWMRWTRRAFVQKENGELAMRYDPNIALPVRTGKLKPTSFIARYAFKRLANKRPTMLVRGLLSDLIEAPQVAMMRKLAPTLEVVDVPEVGHAPMLNEPEVQAALAAFLAKVD